VAKSDPERQAALPTDRTINRNDFNSKKEWQAAERIFNQRGRDVPQLARDRLGVLPGHIEKAQAKVDAFPPEQHGSQAHKKAQQKVNSLTAEQSNIEKSLPHLRSLPMSMGAMVDYRENLLQQAASETRHLGVTLGEDFYFHNNRIHGASGREAGLDDTRLQAHLGAALSPRNTPSQERAAARGAMKVVMGDPSGKSARGQAPMFFDKAVEIGAGQREPDPIGGPKTFVYGENTHAAESKPMDYDSAVARAESVLVDPDFYGGSPQEVEVRERARKLMRIMDGEEPQGGSDQLSFDFTGLSQSHEGILSSDRAVPADMHEQAANTRQKNVVVNDTSTTNVAAKLLDKGFGKTAPNGDEVFGGVPQIGGEALKHAVTQEVYSNLAQNLGEKTGMVDAEGRSLLPTGGMLQPLVWQQQRRNSGQDDPFNAHVAAINKYQADLAKPPTKKAQKEAAKAEAYRQSKMGEQLTLPGFE